MKILLPLISRNGNSIDSPVVTGGIAKVAKNIYELYSNEIIPVIITEEDRANRRTRKVFFDAIKRYNPDMILINYYIECFFMPQIIDNIPTISIIHEPLYRSMAYLNLYSNLHKFVDAGGHVYFVSDNQLQFFQKNILRITGKFLDKVHGLFNPSYCTGEEIVSKDFIYDVATIGRTDLIKNPFYIHDKLHSTGLKTCVLTNLGNFQRNPKHVYYYESNLHWKDPQFTYRGLSHEETMKKLSQAKCYISPAPIESWGITAMESLAHGVPLILVTDRSGRHSSESIAVSKDHYRIISKRAKTHELKVIIEELSNYTYE